MQASLNFSSYIAELSRDFTGREWVFAEIDGWLSDPQSPNFFVITGEPGIGKSAIAARLARFSDGKADPPPGCPNLGEGFLSAHHFCIARQADTIDPFLFAQSISGQLASIPGFSELIAEEAGVHLEQHITVGENIGEVTGVVFRGAVGSLSPLVVFNRLILTPLRKLYEKGYDQTVLILVDALDEAAQLSGETLVDILANIGNLPPQVRVLLTTRPETRVLSYFDGVPKHIVQAESQLNREDLRRYVRYRINKPACRERIQSAEKPIQTGALVERIAGIGDDPGTACGNFLYAKILLNDIESGVQPADDLASLPKGLDEIYQSFLLRLASDWETRYQPMLAVLAAAREPLTREQLLWFSDQSARLIGKRMSATLVNLALGVLVQFLDVRGEAGREQYSLFHQSLRDFLGEISRSGQFACPPEDGHRAIANPYLERFSGDWQECDRYGLLYLPAHLRAAAEWRKLFDLLTDFGFLESKRRVSSVYDLEDDFRLALSDWQGDDQHKAILQAFEERLRLEAHHIQRAPELLFPHLYNHLTWLDAPDGPIHRLCERGRAGRTGWLRWTQDPRPAPTPWKYSLEGHTDIVTALAVTPDGASIVSGSEDNTIKVWDLATGRLLHTLEGHTDIVTALAVTPDGTSIVSGSEDNTVKVWDLATGRLMRSLQGHTDAVNAVAITPDGASIASGSGRFDESEDNTIKVWDLATGRLLRSLEGHTDAVNAVAITPDGVSIVSGSEDNTIKVWDLATGRLLHTLEGHTHTINAVAVTSDGTAIVSASSDRTIKLWDLASGHQVRSLKGHADSVVAVTVTPDGLAILSGSYSGKTVKVWDLSSGRLLRSLRGHAGGVRALAVTPDGATVVSGSEDNTIKVWNLATGRVLHSLEGHTDSVNALAVTPDGASIVSGSWDKTIKLWDLASGRLLRSLTRHTDSVGAVTVTPDGATIVSGSSDKTIKVWNLTTGRVLHSLEGHTDSVTDVAVTPDGASIVSGSVDKTIKVWELASGRVLHSLEGHTDSVTTVAVTPDGAVVVSGSEDKTIKVWELASGRLLRSLNGHAGEVTQIALTPDGATVVSASWDDHRVKVWDLASGHLQRSLEGLDTGVDSVAVSPDGANVIAGSRDNTVKVWDLASGRLLRSLEGHSGFVWAVAIAFGGSTIISASMDKTIKVWDLTSSRALRSLEGHTNPVRTVAVTRDGTKVISGSSQSYRGSMRYLAGLPTAVKVWDLASGRLLRSLAAHAGVVNAVSVTSDGATIISTSMDDHKIKVWDLASGSLLRSLDDQTGEVTTGALTPEAPSTTPSLQFRYVPPVTDVALTPNDDRIVSASGDTVKVWDLASGRLLRSLEGHTYPVLAVAVTPDGATIVSGSMDKTIKVWDLASGRMLRSLNRHTDSVNAVTVAPDGATIISGSSDKTVKLWDRTSGRLLYSLKGHTGAVRAVVAVLNGHTVISASDDKTIRQWDWVSGVGQVLYAGDAAVTCLALSEDSCWLCAGDSAGQVWIFEWIR